MLMPHYIHGVMTWRIIVQRGLGGLGYMESYGILHTDILNPIDYLLNKRDMRRSVYCASRLLIGLRCFKYQ